MIERGYPNYGLADHAATGTRSPNVRWFAPALDRKLLRDLMVLRDGPAIRDTLVWFALLVGSAAGGIVLWGTIWCLPFFVVYGTIYGSSADSRWHETQHKTAFKTKWMNEALHQIACFMILREPTPWKRSHTRHHTDTLHVGRDAEIAAQRPPNFTKIVLNIFGLWNLIPTLSRIVRHAFGRMDADEKTYTPEAEWPKTYRLARLWIVILASVAVVCIGTGSILPAMLVGPLPSSYGGWFAWYVGWTQHAGLAENAVDHRANTRTVYMNPVFRFLYWNMNYHLEHHIFPMVPYHALPRLHVLVRDQLPTPYPSSIVAWVEIVAAWQQQRRDVTYFVDILGRQATTVSGQAGPGERSVRHDPRACFPTKDIGPMVRPILLAIAAQSDKRAREDANSISGGDGQSRPTVRHLSPGCRKLPLRPGSVAVSGLARRYVR